MAHLRHKKVCLSIPLNGAHLEIEFNGKSCFSTPKSTHHSVELMEMGYRKRGRVRDEIFLPDNADNRISINVKKQELMSLNSFAEKVAQKYANTNSVDEHFIINAIVSCYNDVVVEHATRAQLVLPHDVYCVECTPDGQLICKFQWGIGI